MKSPPLKYSLILAAVVAACNAKEQTQGETQAAPGSAAGDPSVVHHPEPPQLPAQKTDSIRLEGTWHRFTARLVQSDAGLRFSTYVPADMIYEPVSSDEGDGHFFFSNFAGRRNDNAYVLVFIFPPGTTEAQARRLAHSFVSSRDTIRGRRQPDQDYQESLFELGFFFRSNGADHFGDIALGKHRDRYFYFAMQYPQEFGDGFGPRADYIRKQWVWLDDGQGLGLTLRPPRGSRE